MDKYIVVEVIDREIRHCLFNSYDEAHKGMRDRIIDITCDPTIEIEVSKHELVKGSYFEVGATEAWADDCGGDKRYDWKIIKVEI